MDEDAIWALLKAVPDPEIPVVSVVDLGIVREVAKDRVRITTTYTGSTEGRALDALRELGASIRVSYEPPRVLRRLVWLSQAALT